MQKKLRTRWLKFFFLLIVFLWSSNCTRPSAPPSTPATPTVQTPATDPYHLYIYAGLPKTNENLRLLTNKAYLVGYSETRKNPAWVAYRVFKVENPQTHARPSRFKTDERTLSKVNHEDYTNTGYDRGHMAPNYAIDICYGKDAQLETFLMSNICPQKPMLNQQVWEHLESTEARDDANRFEEIWVITGPIFDEQTEKFASGVEVPDAFFKILLDEQNGKPKMLAFIIPQGVKGNEVLKGFLVSVDKIEALTGFDFFTELNDQLEENLESATPTEMW